MSGEGSIVDNGIENGLLFQYLNYNCTEPSPTLEFWLDMSLV